MTGGLVLLFIVAAFIGMYLVGRYKKCPPDKIMVIQGGGLGPGKKPALCLHGGLQFVWPIIQTYSFLDLKPIALSVDLRNALSKQNIRIDVPSSFTVGIGTQPEVMQNAAERLMGLRSDAIQSLAQEIIFGQLRLVVATMDIEEINTNRDKFLEQVSINVEAELKKIGLTLINVNVTDINDESGYIDALGKEAAAKAINDAKQSVAEKNRDGSIGEANALREQRIQVAKANSIAIEGENEAKIAIANSEALRRERTAEATKRAVASEKIQEAKALEEAYAAEEQAEKSRANREKATMEANIIVKAEIEKKELEIQAAAEAEQARLRAQGEADSVYLRMEAQARGVEAMLMKQAAGLYKIVEAAGGDTDRAVKLMLADKIETLLKTQVDAIKNIKIDKVTVWDNMNGGKGNTATANFLTGMMNAVPPMSEIFNMAGMDLPSYMGTKKNSGDEGPETLQLVDASKELDDI